MTNPQPTWQLVKAVAERMTATGNSPFKLEDLIREVQRLEPSRGGTSIQPIVQGMTVNARGGPRSAGGKILRRTDHGLYELIPGSTAPTLLLRPTAESPPARASMTGDPAPPEEGLPVLNRFTWRPGEIRLLDQPPETESPLAGNSDEQRAAEAVILAAVGTELGASLAPRRLALGDGVLVDIDGVSDDPPILCEVWAHQGPARVAQEHKLLHDALKLLLAGETLTVRPRLYLAVTDLTAVSRFQGRSWYGLALGRLGVEILVVEIPQDLRARLRTAQARQGWTR